MKIVFHYLQDCEGNISQLKAIAPVSFLEDRNTDATWGDEMLYSCLRNYEIAENKKGFTFNLEYNSTMLKVLEYLGGDKK